MKVSRPNQGESSLTGNWYWSMGTGGWTGGIVRVQDLQSCMLRLVELIRNPGSPWSDHHVWLLLAYKDTWDIGWTVKYGQVKESETRWTSKEKVLANWSQVHGDSSGTNCLLSWQLALRRGPSQSPRPLEHIHRVQDWVLIARQTHIGHDPQTKGKRKRQEPVMGRSAIPLGKDYRRSSDTLKE